MNKRTLILGCTAFAMVGALAACAGGPSTSSPSTNDAGVPETTVRFAVEPYADHTDASIGIDKGWFDEVGITLDVQNVDADKVSSVLVAGSVDVASAAPALLAPSLTAGDFETFVYGDLFQGYAILGSDDLTSYEEFVKSGLDPDDAAQQAMAQMKGKVFTYPSEAAIKPFIDLAFQEGGISLDEVTSEVQPDSNGVTLMLSGRADFEVGGVPSRVALEAEGFKPIIRSIDLVQRAEASADSEALRSIAHNGWSTTTAYAEANHDTILRLASVKYRINQFINDNPEEACAIHMPYLNSLAGTEFGDAECAVIYNSLDPYYTYEQQRSWFEDETDPLYWEYETASVLSLYEGQGVLEPGAFKPSDLVTAPAIFAELEKHRITAQAALEELAGIELSDDAAALMKQAQAFYDAFDYLDADLLSAQALDSAS